ncbi:MAG: twin-arginine translocase subunit TatC [Bacteroidales bacterium]|nr:twin-arginine translocase subunit TatC [Bacteroidales bacterium]
MSNKKKSTQNKPNEMTFWEHLDELRSVLIRSIIAIGIFSVIAFFFKEFIYDTVILGPRKSDFFTNSLLCSLGDILNSSILCINQKSFEIINIEMAGQFRSHLIISFVTGIVFAFPYFLFELWKFIKPAFHENESKSLKGFVFYTSFLFAIGILFGYYIINPLAINFLISYEISPEVVNQIKLGSYISNVLMICLSTGLVFELPLLIYFLTKMGMITPQILKKYRKHSAILFFILSAIITPPDIFSQFLVAMPLFLLYEISISISKRVTKKQFFS